MPLIISMVGYSNSGKTTLLGKMIPLLKAEGYSVGIVKHTEHDFFLEQSGKDSHRFGQAGAEGVALVGCGQIGFWGKMDEPEPLILDRIEQSFFFNRDIILTEGFKKGGKPKIAVLTKGKEEELLKEIEGSIIATVGEDPVRADLPHFKPDDPEGLVKILVDRFLKDRNKPSIRIILDGKNIPLNHFVQEMVQGSIRGLLSPLKGFKESRNIEVKISLQDKGRAR
ncbi:MAG: molybdopterin-guanine dinucleotide biosynthesis protein B [Pseudomonadota bacterium]